MPSLWKTCWMCDLPFEAVPTIIWKRNLWGKGTAQSHKHLTKSFICLYTYTFINMVVSAFQNKVIKFVPNQCCVPLGLVHTGERQSMSVHTIQITVKRECWLDAIWCELAHVQLLGTYALWSRATASTLHNISSTAFETITFLLFSTSKCPKEWNSTSQTDRVTLGWVGGVFPPTSPFSVFK